MSINSCVGVGGEGGGSVNLYFTIINSFRDVDKFNVVV